MASLIISLLTELSDLAAIAAMYQWPARGHYYDVIAGDSYQLDRRRDLVRAERYLRPTADLLASCRRAASKRRSC